MTRQLELKLNDPKHPVHETLLHFISVTSMIKKLKKERAAAAEELIKVMDQHKMLHITINGVTILRRKLRAVPVVRLTRSN